MNDKSNKQPTKGRGATVSPSNRYASHTRAPEDDGWYRDDADAPAPATELAVDHSRTVISYNTSPDVPFDRSINPYRGCEHGCVYCFARPTHAYLGLSPGLDFETKLFYKPDAVAQLRAELNARSYRSAPMAVGINTDAYQPVERRLQLTRSILELLVACQHPFTVVTKSALIERDVDLLARAAQRRQVSVAVSITTLDRELARKMEPRAAAPQRRLEVISKLSAAGVPVTVLVAPVIPALTDHELESILEAARAAGAGDAGYVVLRLPHELKEIVGDWLTTHHILRAEHVMNRVRDMRGGAEYRAEFGERMRGSGVFADLLQRRFDVTYRRLGFARGTDLDITSFVPPGDARQLTLF